MSKKRRRSLCTGYCCTPAQATENSDNVRLAVRMRCYEVLRENYYPGDRMLLALNPAPMRYAGPREAISHALVRKNFACTHFIVGRDHAGAGNFQGAYDARKIFDEFSAGELGITRFFFENTFHCHRCASMASPKTCGHDASSRVILSGTQVRAIVAGGGQPRPEFAGAEVAEVLHQAYCQPASK